MQSSPSSMDRASLDSAEIECLAAYARDEQGFNAQESVLARLEHLGLLMRGWGRTFVVTRLGHHALRKRVAL